jgi:hypothetical protein
MSFCRTQGIVIDNEMANFNMLANPTGDANELTSAAGVGSFSGHDFPVDDALL